MKWQLPHGDRRRLRSRGPCACRRCETASRCAAEGHRLGRSEHGSSLTGDGNGRAQGLVSGLAHRSRRTSECLCKLSKV